jgi:putative glycosyltransferase (TIGR04348 family)
MVEDAKPVLFIVTPGTPHANNGNWRTAWRWSQMLRDRYRIIVQTQWRGERADALVALHARRSAESVAEFRARGAGPIVVVLTGTDLYRDLGKIEETARSLDTADRIVVLQEDAPRLLERHWRAKCDVIFQSARSIRRRRNRDGVLRCAVLGHLREEKDPLTVIRAFDHLPANLPIRVRHIGAALDEDLARAARAFARTEPRYRYVGALPHGLARAALASSDLLIHPSIMEGGANVIVEAVTAGTAVVASRMSGNVGMLGREYRGYFKVGDAKGLARLLERCQREPAFLRALERACATRKPLFRPEAEARAIRATLRKVLM